MSEGQSIIIDVETSGLPFRGSQCKKYPNYKDIDAYSTSRVVSISWIIVSSKKRVVDKQYYIIKPVDFRISRESTSIHGINRRDAMANGITFFEVVTKLRVSLAIHPCRTLVAHNIYFDFNILLSEFYRIRQYDMIRTFYNLERFCTMIKGKQHLGLGKFPKLVDMYTTLTGKSLENAHNALADAEGCLACFIALTL